MTGYNDFAKTWRLGFPSKSDKQLSGSRRCKRFYWLSQQQQVQNPVKNCWKKTTKKKKHVGGGGANKQNSTNRPACGVVVCACNRCASLRPRRPILFTLSFQGCLTRTLNKNSHHRTSGAVGAAARKKNKRTHTAAAALCADVLIASSCNGALGKLAETNKDHPNSERPSKILPDCHEPTN